MVSTELSAPFPREFAFRLGVLLLYKYRSLRNEQERAWLREIVLEHKIFFSRPSMLNDPRDLRPRLRIARASSEQETRKILVADAERVWKRNRVPEEALERNRARLADISVSALRSEGEKRAHERLEDYWIFSMCQDGLDVVMWAKYADHRRGVCLHFRSDAGSPFGLAQRVHYQREHPTLDFPFAGQDEKAIAAISTLTKTRKWAYEREFRLVKYPDFSYDEAGMRHEGQYGFFRPEMLVAIAVGERMPPGDCELVQDMAAQRDPPLAVYRPRRVKQRR